MIVIDGVDGSGKGVQTRRLLQALIDAGHPAIFTREPGGKTAAEGIPAHLVTSERGKWDNQTELLIVKPVRATHAGTEGPRRGQRGG